MRHYCQTCPLCGKRHFQKKHWWACQRRKKAQAKNGKDIDKSQETQNTPILHIKTQGKENQQQKISQIQEVALPLDCLCGISNKKDVIVQIQHIKRKPQKRIRLQRLIDPKNERIIFQQTYRRKGNYQQALGRAKKLLLSNPKGSLVSNALNMEKYMLIFMDYLHEYKLICDPVYRLGIVFQTFEKQYIKRKNDLTLQISTLEAGDSIKRKYCVKLLDLNESIFEEYFLEWSEMSPRMERLRRQYNKFAYINNNYCKLTKQNIKIDKYYQCLERIMAVEVTEAKELAILKLNLANNAAAGPKPRIGLIKPQCFYKGIMGQRLQLAEELIFLVNQKEHHIKIPFLHHNGKTEVMSVAQAKSVIQVRRRGHQRIRHHFKKQKQFLKRKLMRQKCNIKTKQIKQKLKSSQEQQFLKIATIHNPEKCILMKQKNKKELQMVLRQLSHYEIEFNKKSLYSRKTRRLGQTEMLLIRQARCKVSFNIDRICKDIAFNQKYQNAIIYFHQTLLSQLEQQEDRTSRIKLIQIEKKKLFINPPQMLTNMMNQIKVDPVFIEALQGKQRQARIKEEWNKIISARTLISQIQVDHAFLQTRQLKQNRYEIKALTTRASQETKDRHSERLKLKPNSNPFENILRISQYCEACHSYNTFLRLRCNCVVICKCPHECYQPHSFVVSPNNRKWATSQWKRNPLLLKDLVYASSSNEQEWLPYFEARKRERIYKYVYDAEVPLFITVDGVPKFTESLCAVIEINLSHSHLYPFVIREVSKAVGLGVFANAQIKAGTLICPYIGEICYHTKCQQYSDSIMEIGYINNRLLVIRTLSHSNIARYINSQVCEERVNCQTSIGIYNNTMAILIYSIKDIPKGQQLLYNYGKQYDIYKRA